LLAAVCSKSPLAQRYAPLEEDKEELESPDPALVAEVFMVKTGA